jgi:hypothetical protein
MIYLYEKFHIRRSSSSFVIAIKPKVDIGSIVRVTAMLLL